MPQTLEDKLYQEYRIRASESLKGNSELAGRTEPLELEPSQPQAPPRKSIWDTADTGEYPDWYERASDEAPESNMLNAVGVGLWSAFDTGFFESNKIDYVVAGKLLESEKERNENWNVFDLGDKLHWYDRIDGVSTSEIIERIQVM